MCFVIFSVFLTIGAYGSITARALCSIVFCSGVIDLMTCVFVIIVFYFLCYIACQINSFYLLFYQILWLRINTYFSKLSIENMFHICRYSCDHDIVTPVETNCRQHQSPNWQACKDTLPWDFPFLDRTKNCTKCSIRTEVS